MGNVSERRKLKTAEEFRKKAISLRKVAQDLEREEARQKLLSMADAWDEKAAAAEDAAPRGSPANG